MSSFSPLISVIVPAYNASRWIARCIESILRQTYSRLEILVIDDASTDDTAGELRRIAAMDERVTVITQSKNGGVQAARAAGMRKATGEYVGFVDADDWIAPEMYDTLMDTAQGEHADIVMCGAVCGFSRTQFGPPKVVFPRREVITERLRERFARLEFGTGVLWNKLYRAEVIRPFVLLPLERSVDAAEDYIVNFGAFSLARKAVALPSPLYVYFLDPASATRSTSIAASFCRTLRAYVVCLETYALAEPDAALWIDELYRRQLRYESYAVDSAHELEPHEEHLRASLTRLAAVHPAGAYALIHTFDIPKPAAPAKRPITRRVLASGRRLVGRWVRNLAGGVTGQKNSGSG